MLKTLQHKASKSRLRKSVAIDTDALPLPLPTDPATSPTATTGTSPIDGFMFWKKKEPAAPAYEKTSERRGREQRGDLSPGAQPKPILRRPTDPSPSPVTPPLRFPDGRFAARAYTTPAAIYGTSPGASSSGSPSGSSSTPPSLAPRSPASARHSSPRVPVPPLYPEQKRVASPRVHPATPSVHATSPISPMGSYSPASPAPSASTSVSTPKPQRTSSRRSSRPGSSASAYTYNNRASVVSTPQPPRRAASVLGNNGGVQRRKSSRPVASSSHRTRASIASYSTRSSILSPSSSVSHGLGQAFSTSSSSSTLEPIAEPSEHAGSPQSMATITGSPLHDSPPSIRPSTPQRLPLSESDEDIPMFNVIPATPQKDVELDGDDSGRRTPLGRPSTSSVLHEMPEEDEEDEATTPVQRLITFEDVAEAFDLQWPPSASPRLDESIDLSYGSPITLALRPLDEVDEAELDDAEAELDGAEAELDDAVESSSDSHGVCTAENSADSHDAAVVASADDEPAVPPLPPKSPARKHVSLYQAHDDGKSISRSLAELASLACDLPPLDLDLVAAAQSAAAQNAARVSTAVSSPRPETATAPTTPPSRSVPLAPAASTAPATPAGMRRVNPACSPAAFVAYTAPSHPLPPSPPFNSYPSLPSLISHDSMPSSMSGHSMPTSHSLASIASSPDADEALGSMLRSLSTEDPLGLRGLSEAAECPTTPKAVAKDLSELPVDFSEPAANGLGLGLDIGTAGSVLASPFSPTERAFDKDDEELADAPLPPRRIHRMSAAAAHPHRLALYGTPRLYTHHSGASFSSTSSRASTGSYSSGSYSSSSFSATGGPTRHSLSSSISSRSLSLVSDFSSDDDLLTASIVAGSQAFIVGREDARAHEVGVAF
ncbi:hypothetical protein Q8F55_001115 [Vanrija albida]|uniref:AGC-kinase C-terminal domain-containing protein n=1 Tax=Vanrija albida TaxID=181172 RepID=A0ABR3QG83_9TREE